MLSSWLAQSMVVGSSTPTTFSSSTSVLPLGHHQGFCSVLVLSTVQIVDNFRKTQPHFIVITMAAVSLSERLSDAAMKINAVTTLLWGMTPFDGRFALGHAKVCVGTRRKVNGKSSAAWGRRDADGGTAWVPPSPCRRQHPSPRRVVPQGPCHTAGRHYRTGVADVRDCHHRRAASIVPPHHCSTCWEGRRAEEDGESGADV